jgi:phosphate/sulfate permease
MNKTAFKIIGSVVFGVLLFGILFEVLKLASALVWWLVVIPLVGTTLGLVFSYIIKRVILPKGSPHRESPAITTGAVATGWVLVLVSSCS